MTKKILFLLTFLLTTIGGGNSAWAFRYVAYFGDGSYEDFRRNDGVSTNYFTFSDKHSVQATRYADSNNIPTYFDQLYNTDLSFSTALKMEAQTQVSFTCTGSVTVTVLVSTYDTACEGNVANGTIKFDNAEQTTPSSTSDGYKEYRIENVAAGTHTITKGTGQAGVFYIRVTDDANMTMSVNYNDMMYGGTDSNNPRIVVSNEFAYVTPDVYRNQGSLTSTYLRFKVNLSSALSNIDDITVASDNMSVMTYNSKWFANDAHTQVYVQMEVVGSSSTPANVTVTHTETNATCTGTFTVNPNAMTPYNNSYPYKWDFQNDEWTSTRLQLYNSTISGGVWTSTNANAVIKQAIGTGVTSNVNMIKSLAFDAVNEGLTLDWTNKKVSLVAESKIRIPGTLDGRIVTFDASGEFAWDSEGTVTKMGANKFYVTSGTGVIFRNSSAVDIYSIDVSETGVATYETTDAGVFQFTGNGTLAGGTVIKDVPGIEMTIGNGGTWNVNDVTNSNVTLKCATYSTVTSADAILVFRPIVNGYLTLKGKFYGGNGQNTRLYLNGSDNSSVTVLDNTVHYVSEGDLVISTPLKAGVTYTLTNGTHYNNEFHGFSFEPAFLNTSSTGRQSAENPAVFDATGSTTVFPSILTDANEYVTFAASAGGAITVAENGNGTPTLVTPTSTPYTITATIASPNSNVTSKTATYQLTYTATAVTLSFNWTSPCNTNYAENGTYKNVVTARAGETDVTTEMETWTYTSSDPSIATVASDGTVTILNSGLIEITVTATDTQGIYQSATASYWLTINPTTDVTLTLSKGTSDYFFNYGYDYINQGSVNVDGPTITYESSNTAIATVNSSGKVEGVKPSDDWVTITVRSSQYKQYRAASATYKVKVLKGTLSMQFVPKSIILNQGEYVIPHMNITNVVASTIQDQISVTTTENSVAALDNPAYVLETPDGRLNRMNVKITGGSHEQSTDQEATVTASVTGSEYYEDITTTIKVTVRAASNAQKNFAWKSGVSIPEYTIYQGDFMLIPPIDGNCSHNADYSMQSNRKYPKKIGSNQGISKNMDKDYRPNEGVPNYMIVNAKSDGSAPDKDASASNDYAYVVFAQAQGSSRTGNEPDSLMVYAKIDNLTTDHVVYLRAVDSNNSNYYCDAKITIKPKATLDQAFSNDVAAMSFPFTWDFTQFSSDDFALFANDKVYYEPKNSGTSYYLGTGYMNAKNSLDPGSYKTISKAKSNDLYFQNMVVRTSDGNLKTLKQFKGLKIALNGTYYNSKIDRVRINSTSPHLTFIGGPTEFLLPTVASMPASFKVFVKLSGTSGKKVYFRQGNPAEQSVSMTTGDQIVSFDATNSGGDITLRFEDCSVYWIACSTEAKSIGTAAGGSDHMASYSYSQTMDYGKSFEANEVDAYVATAVTNEGSASNPAINALKVTLQKSNTSVPSGTGVVLKATDAKNAYMIADARNEETYEIPSVPETNLLRGTGNGCTIYELAGDETGTTSGSSYVPFYLSSKFRDYSVGSGIGEQQNAGYYAYWRVYGSQSMPANYSYLVLDATTYKDTYGKPADINEGAASRILLAFDESDDDSGTTGIENVRDSVMDSDAWYTLQGVKVNAPAKGGIYIHKGKKVVVK